MHEYRRFRRYEFGLPVRILVCRGGDRTAVRVVRDVCTALAVRDGWLRRARNAGWLAVWDGSTVVLTPLPR